MTENDLAELNKGRALRLFAERDGALIGEVSLAGFVSAGGLVDLAQVWE